MTRAGRSRRRYVLVRFGAPPTGEARATLLKQIKKRDPSSQESLLLERYLIIRTGHRFVSDVVGFLDGRLLDGSTLRTVGVAGAIAKLKRLASSSSGG